MKNVNPVRRIALLSMMIAVTHVGRLMLQILPNVQPVTTILIILTLSMGIADGLIVAVLSILISNLTLGMGIWTFAQIISFSVIVLITGLVIKPMYKKIPKWMMVLYAAFAGILYGLVVSFIMKYLLGFENFWAYYMMGVPMDLMHAFGNGLFYIILSPVLFPLIEKNLETRGYIRNRSKDI
ncbi:ECF transporter S component [Desemzia sp. C1]|uniref:ECF transporter S component n=1 Tax=Desemzia sp. C1 TaxID=2892016 RepID=UPI001E3D46CC|nr:ECF transporter S component [Desemzia sp. C1]MCI3029290.1 ECF transporter S component [Desemzia sp. C1]